MEEVCSLSGDAMTEGLGVLSPVGSPGTERNWLTTDERGRSMEGANEDEDGRSTVVAVGPPAEGE